MVGELRRNKCVQVCVKGGCVTRQAIERTTSREMVASFGGVTKRCCRLGDPKIIGDFSIASDRDGQSSDHLGYQPRNNWIGHRRCKEKEGGTSPGDCGWGCACLLYSCSRSLAAYHPKIKGGMAKVVCDRRATEAVFVIED